MVKEAIAPLHRTRTANKATTLLQQATATREEMEVVGRGNHRLKNIADNFKARTVVDDRRIRGHLKVVKKMEGVKRRIFNEGEAPHQKQRPAQRVEWMCQPKQKQIQGPTE